MFKSKVTRPKARFNCRHKKVKKGFTLIEMIIVIAVMAIIGAVAIPSLSGVKDSVAKKADNESCATIERTTKMVLADKDLSKYTGTYGVTFTGDTVSVSGGDNGVAEELQNCLADIKGPQENDKKGFSIDIKNSKIKVSTT